jgi:hypothetical protein
MFGTGWSRLALLTTSAVLACTRVPAVAPQPEVETPLSAPTVVVEAPSDAATTCIARTPKGALLLIPDMAEWVVHVGPNALLRSPAYQLFARQIEQSAQWTRMLDVLRPCGVAVEQVDHVLVGFNAAEDFVAVLVGPGIARPEVARCLITQSQAALSEQPEQAKPSVADIRPLPGDASLSVIESTDGRAYLFGDDMLTLSSSAWQDAVADLSSCRGAPVYRSLAAHLREIDLDAPLWLIGAPSSSSVTTLGSAIGVDLSGVSSVSASVHLDDGAALRARAQMRDAAEASSTAQMLSGLMTLVGSAIPPELSGLPSRIVFDSSDTHVRLEMTVRPEELRFMAGQIP